MAREYSIAEIQSVIATAKCALGDLGCEMYYRKRGGMTIHSRIMIGKEISLLIWGLEGHITFLVEEKMTDAEAVVLTDRLQGLTGCVCEPGSATTAAAQHTTYSHTVESHTE